MTEKPGSNHLTTALLIVVVIVAVPVAVLLYNNRPPHISVPTHKVPSPNAWDGFARAAAMSPGPPYCGPLCRSDKKVQDWTVADYRADYPSFISHCSAAITELKKSLGQPYMHPPERDAYSLCIPIYAQVRELARISTSKALYENALGRPGDAMDSFLDVLDLGVTLPKGGPIVADLAGTAVEAIGRRNITESGVVDKLDGAELARAARRLEAIAAKRTSIGDVLTEEGYMSAASRSRTFCDSEYRWTLVNPAKWRDAGSSYGGKSAIGSFWIGSRLAFEDKSAVVREELAYWKAVAAEQSAGYTGKCSVPLPGNIYGHVTDWSEVVVRLSVHHAQAEEKLAKLQTEIALTRFKLDHRSYPKSLTELRPKYLKKLPADPFAKKKPLQYKVTEGGQSFMLYSVGP